MSFDKIIYEIDIGKILVLADSEQNAKIGACNYIGTNIDIENLKAIALPKLDPEQGDTYDWEE